MGESHQELTDRQRRELEYHREHAKKRAEILSGPLPYDVLFSGKRRWWNAYWEMFRFLMQRGISGRDVLVVGCGVGEDAVRLAKLGARVQGFDLSPESLEVARKLAEQEGQQVDLRRMTSEKLDYESDRFDWVLARDVLHHVEIPETVGEIARVARDGAIFVVNEIYSHSVTRKIRNSRLVEHRLYPALRKFVYQGRDPYITEDERKLTELDIEQVCKPMTTILYKRYFNFVVTRLIPDRFSTIEALDRLTLMAAFPIAHVLGGRILMAGEIGKTV